MGDRDPGALPADSAVSADVAYLVVSGVLELRKDPGEHSRGGAVSGTGSVLCDRLVRPLFVVFRAKPVEAHLLRRQVAFRGTGGLAFQGAVHSLMAAVLFWVGRLDELGVDPEPDPPH